MGDGLHAVFRSTVEGVSACLNAQLGLAQEPWGETGSLRVRMAVHKGEAAERAGGYYGPTLNRAARLNGGDLDNENAFLEPQTYMFAEAVSESGKYSSDTERAKYAPGTIVAIRTVEIQPGAAYLS